MDPSWGKGQGEEEDIDDVRDEQLRRRLSWTSLIFLCKD